jgi:hypothetical protein
MCNGWLIDHNWLHVIGSGDASLGPGPPISRRFVCNSVISCHNNISNKVCVHFPIVLVHFPWVRQPQNATVPALCFLWWSVRQRKYRAQALLNFSGCARFAEGMSTHGDTTWPQHLLGERAIRSPYSVLHWFTVEVPTHEGSMLLATDKARFNAV